MEHDTDVTHVTDVTDGRRDAGQVTVVVAAGLVLAVALVAGLGLMGRALVDRAQARTAADAAALAGAAEDETAAQRVARANGAVLERFDEVRGAVVVEVSRRGVSALARAREVPEPGRRIDAAGAGGPGAGGGGGGTGMRAGLAPDLLAALARADRMLGVPVPIASGLRSRAQQQSLWDRRHTNPYPVARPGSSNHERGRAVDVPRRFVPRLLAVAGSAGLCQPMPRTDPVHFEVCR